MQSTHCLNCGTAITAGQKFCPHCGQKTDTGRLSFYQLLRDFFVFITRADRGIWNLLKGLAIRPGRTAAEYVEGKRKTYFNPFAFLTLCIGIMVFLNHYIKPYTERQEANPFVLARIPDEATRQAYLHVIERINRVQNFTDKNLNIISVIITPYFALGLWLFFRRRKRNIAEITVAYILFSGFSNVLFTVLVSPWQAMSRNAVTNTIIFFTGLFFENFYFAWGFNRFFGYNSTAGFFKMVGVLLLIGCVGLVLLIGLLFLYAYHGDGYRVMQYM
jgi:hypothetical protein